MADIPVERKQGGFPWWLIPLILLLLLLPLLYFCSRNTAVVDNTNGNTNRIVATNANNAAMMNKNGATNMGSNVAVVVNSNTAANMTNGNMSASGAALTDVNAFGTATDKMALVGRGVTLSGVRVNRVLSDKVFTVKSGSGELFVMLDNNLDSAGGKEQQIKMKAGQNVNLGGAFRTVPTGEVKEETKEGGLNKNEYAQMKGQQVYLHATSVEDAK